MREAKWLFQPAEWDIKQDRKKAFSSVDRRGHQIRPNWKGTVVWIPPWFMVVTIFELKNLPNQTRVIRAMPNINALIHQSCTVFARGKFATNGKSIDAADDGVFAEIRLDKKK